MGAHRLQRRRWTRARGIRHPPEDGEQKVPASEAEPSSKTDWCVAWVHILIGNRGWKEDLCSKERQRARDKIEAEERRVADKKRWAKHAAARAATTLLESVDYLPIVREDGLVRYDRERSQKRMSGKRAVVFHGRIGVSKYTYLVKYPYPMVPNPDGLHVKMVPVVWRRDIYCRHSRRVTLQTEARLGAGDGAIEMRARSGNVLATY